MTDYQAVMIAEGVQEPKDFNEYIAAWQHISDNNLHLHLQGFFGRQVAHLKEQGFIQ